MTARVDGEASLDLLGAGKLAKAIPPHVWDRLVTTACETFTQCVAPITATTSGLGRLIQAWFDRLSDAQKVLAASTASRASRKMKPRGGKATRRMKTRVVIATLEAASVESEPAMRELWENLLAREWTDGSVHPDFPGILSRLDSSDAHALALIGERAPGLEGVPASALLKSLVRLGFAAFTEKQQFEHEHLGRLGLVRPDDHGVWRLSEMGKAFLRVVTDPSIEQKGQAG